MILNYINSIIIIIIIIIINSAGNTFSYFKEHVSFQTFILKGHIWKLVCH